MLRAPKTARLRHGSRVVDSRAPESAQWRLACIRPSAWQQLGAIYRRHLLTNLHIALDLVPGRRTGSDLASTVQLHTLERPLECRSSAPGSAGRRPAHARPRAWPRRWAAAARQARPPWPPSCAPAAPRPPCAPSPAPRSRPCPAAAPTRPGSATAGGGLGFAQAARTA